MSTTKNIDIVIKAKDDASGVLRSVGNEMRNATGASDGLGASYGMTTKKAAAAGATAGLVAAAVQAAIGPFKDMAAAVIGSATNYEQQRIAFETMLGSGERAQKLLVEISKFAKKTPFELPEVIEGAKSLAAYGIEAEKLIPTLKVMGDIASGVGTEKLPDLIRAFGQVRSKGKLMAQELNQFAEAGVPLREMLAKDLKMSVEDFSIALDKGQLDIKFADVEKSLKNLTSEGGRFFNLMDKQSQTVAGKWSNLKDNLSSIGRALIGIQENGEVKEGSLFDRMGEGIDVANNLSGSLKNLVAPMSEYDQATRTAGGSAEFLTLALRRQERASAELSIAQKNYADAEAALPALLNDVAIKRQIATEKLAQYNEIVRQYGAKSLEAEQAQWRLKAANDAVDDSLMKEATSTLKVISTKGELNRATNELTSATANYNSLLLTLKNGTMPGLEVSMNSVRIQAQTTASGIQSTVGTTTDGLLVLNGKIGSLQNNVAGASLYVGNQLKGLQSQADRLTGSINQLQSASGGKLQVSARAKGGPVSSNTPYLVGEEGPELFVPNTSGQIVNNKETMSGQGVTQYNTFNVFNEVDLEASVREIGWRLARA